MVLPLVLLLWLDGSCGPHLHDQVGPSFFSQKDEGKYTTVKMKPFFFAAIERPLKNDSAGPFINCGR